jgi:peptidoglycan LD-endopeptidase LytH
VVALVLVAAGVAAALVAGCRPPRLVRDAIVPASPHEQYLRGLETAGLADTALARAWREQAQSALGVPTPATPPFAEELFVDAASPRAVAYAIPMRRGQRLEIEATLESDVPARVFIDAFEMGASGEVTGRARASAGEDDSVLTYEPDRDERVVVRVQPELLRGGRLRVTSRAAATLLFPVPSVTPVALQSIFGDPRDAGQRRHEGVDIFAPRGSPVVAATDGVVSSIGENRLGGRVVWLWDMRRGQSLYYAHLSEQLVTWGTVVRRGDVLGRVGTTGNAAATAPHLHFGIYTGSGAIDPEPFIRPVPATPATPARASREALGQWARVSTTRAVVQQGPSAASPGAGAIPRQTPVRITGAVDAWVRVTLPDSAEGFLPVRAVSVAPRPLRTVRVLAETALRTRPDASATVRAMVPSSAPLHVIGAYREHALVETDAGERGWAILPST